MLGTSMKPAGTTRLLKIGEVARLSGSPVSTILHYEKRSLLKPVARSEAGHRLYSREVVARLEFIKRAKRVGHTLNEIKELLPPTAEEHGWGGESSIASPEKDVLLVQKLRETEQQMEELAAFRGSLLRFLRSGP